MDKVTFMKRVMLWTAAVVAVVMLACGLIWGKVIEENLFQEIAKWVVMYFFIAGIFEVFAYVLSRNSSIMAPALTRIVRSTNNCTETTRYENLVMGTA